MNAEPEKDDIENVNNPSIVGDVIGDTAYSERYVLKLLLKVANKDTLLEALKESSFEQELCTLWDMTAERDVVLFLLTHETLNLFTFALPQIDSPRILEIIIGTIANMCCHKEAVNTFMTKENLIELLLYLLKSDDSRILIQLLRLISSCIYEYDEQMLLIWFDWFKKTDYAGTLYFILKNSTNKDLLLAALENLNTLNSNCQTLDTDALFVELFVTAEANDVLRTAHSEYCKQTSNAEELERLHMITLNTTLNLTKKDDEVGFDNSESAIYLLQDILVSYESRMKQSYKIDPDLINVLATIYRFTSFFNIAGTCSPDKYFTPCFNIWKVLIPNGRQIVCEEENREGFIEDIKEQLGRIMCQYMAHCGEMIFLQVLCDLTDEYESIISTDDQYGPAVARRTILSRNRLLVT